jgi:hypothetical protein
MTYAPRLLSLSVFLAAIALLAGLGPWAAPAKATYGGPPRCDANALSCTEVVNSIGYHHAYTGHDEPSLLFYSSIAGSGNSNIYRLTLPKDPPTLPKQDGTGGTFNFQLHPTFWLGMAMCDTQSAPEYTTTCTPDSDTNIFDDPDPASEHYIGKHPGTAFMEMQFYAPGWVQWPFGTSCDPSRWCAALNIDSLSVNQNTGEVNNAACIAAVGIEPVNFAFITKDGEAQAPANPVDATLATYTPDPSKDLFLQSGDTLVVAMHDTPAGFQIVIHDLTQSTSGSMTASIANGFGQVVFDPFATTCTVNPYAFHPMYATSSEHTRVPWAAHSSNVAFSDEIGHFEYCNAVAGEGGPCVVPGVNDPSGPDSDDVDCFAPPFLDPFQSTRVQIGGCLGADVDFDGVSYQHTWPGSLSDPEQDALLHPSPIRVTSPLFNGTQSYDRVAFEADLPRIEADDFGGNCDRSTGADCVNPPPGAAFYPFYSTGTSAGQCVWQLGGANIPGTTHTFGGSSKEEFGPLLRLFYPGPGFTPFSVYNDFRKILSSNPC